MLIRSSMSTSRLLFSILVLLLLIFSACYEIQPPNNDIEQNRPYIKILGTIQDAGYPQIGCMKACCREKWAETMQKKMITCLGLIDPKHRHTFMFEASPDFKMQSKLLSDCINKDSFSLPDALLLSHAHMGHYVGLMHLGREAMNASAQKVYAMPGMIDYLQNNGPWSLLDSLKNVVYVPLKADSLFVLNPRLSIEALLVPHRGEFSETVGFRIHSDQKKVLFIPDIDKWHLWDRDILEEIKKVDYALLDATFYKNGEVGNRDMSEIPHPFMEESMALFSALDSSNRAKIHFIHFNHSNPVLNPDSSALSAIKQQGYHLAVEGMDIEL